MSIKLSVINHKISDKFRKSVNCTLQATNSQKGFSLVEMVVIVAIAGMIILFLGNVPSSLGLIGGSKQEAEVNQIISQEIEKLRATGYQSLANGTSEILDSRLNSIPDATSEVLIEDCPVDVCLNDEDIKRVTITVAWTSSGKNKEVKVQTLISDGGLQ